MSQKLDYYFNLLWDTSYRCPEKEFILALEEYLQTEISVVTGSVELADPDAYNCDSYRPDLFSYFTGIGCTTTSMHNYLDFRRMIDNLDKSDFAKKFWVVPGSVDMEEYYHEDEDEDDFTNPCDRD